MGVCFILPSLHSINNLSDLSDPEQIQIITKWRCITARKLQIGYVQSLHMLKVSVHIKGNSDFGLTTWGFKLLRWAAFCMCLNMKNTQIRSLLCLWKPHTLSKPYQADMNYGHHNLIIKSCIEGCDPLFFLKWFRVVWQWRHHWANIHYCRNPCVYICIKQFCCQQMQVKIWKRPIYTLIYKTKE